MKNDMLDNLLLGQCHYCKTHPAEKDAMAHIVMYGNVRNIFRGVEYQRIMLPVPRCRQCKRLHNWATTFDVIGVILVFPLTFGFTAAVGVVLSPGWQWLIGILSFFAILIGTVMLLGVICDKLLLKQVLAKLNITTFPPAVEMIKQGWLPVRPSPYARYDKKNPYERSTIKVKNMDG